MRINWTVEVSSNLLCKTVHAASSLPWQAWTEGWCISGVSGNAHGQWRTWFLTHHEKRSFLIFRRTRYWSKGRLVRKKYIFRPKSSGLKLGLERHTIVDGSYKRVRYGIPRIKLTLAWHRKEFPDKFVSHGTLLLDIIKKLCWFL